MKLESDNIKERIFMKKILFGIMLIFLGMYMIFLSEFQNVLEFETPFYVILPLLGLGMSVWGLFEKDK